MLRGKHIKHMTKDEISFPIRINRYLALKGLCTRRGADELLRAGLVRLNGKPAHIGDRVTDVTDKVEVLESGRKRDFEYIAYYKPRGVITHSPQRQRGEVSIGEVSGFPGMFPVGRLDKESEGLILLTDDGRVTERLLHPRFAHEKEYEVTVRERIEATVPKLLKAGIRSEGERLTAKEVTITGSRTLSIVLTEGKKHQIRRMLDSAHLTVERLVRVRIMGIRLGALKPGKGRKLTGTARQAFLKGLGLGENRFV